MKTVTIDNLEVCLYDYMDIKIKEICGSDLLFQKIKEEFVDINDLRCAKKWELVDLGLTPLISEMILKYAKDVWNHFYKPVFFREKVEKHTLGVTNATT